MNKRFAGQNSGFRRRNERERLFFIAAAGLAFSLLIISLVVFNFRTDANAKEVIAPKVENPVPKTLGTVTLFAPEKAVTQGARLSEIKLKEVYWPHDQIPEGAVRDLAEVKTMFATENLKALVPLQRSMLSSEPVQTSLPVTPGNRAIAIQLDAYSGIEGHVRPGSKVDVTLTYTDQGEYTTRVIVQNARVLSYGGVANSSRELITGARQVSNSATLDVSQEDALKILTSRRLGSLSLIMRAPEDVKPANVLEKPESGIGSDKKKSKAVQHCGVMRAGTKEFAVDCQTGRLLEMNPE